MQGLTRTIENRCSRKARIAPPSGTAAKAQVSHDRIRGPWATSGLLKKVGFRRTVQFASLSQTPMSTAVSRWKHAGGNGGKMLLRILGESRYRHTSHTTGTAQSPTILMVDSRSPTAPLAARTTTRTRDTKSRKRRKVDMEPVDSQ